MYRVWTFEKLCQQKKLMKLLGVTVRPDEIVTGKVGARMANIHEWYSQGSSYNAIGYRRWDQFDIHYWIAGVLFYAKH